ncbi:MAG: diaminopimelate epimerase [Pseudomonadota bacterium]
MTYDDPLESIRGCYYAVMDGAGNDFVIVDLRQGGTMTDKAIAALANRDGIYGCDQVIGIEDGPAMKIWNADGSVAEACGNASRCVAEILMREEGTSAVTFGSPAGQLSAKRRDKMVSVDMGEPRLRWDQIPISHPTSDTTALPVPTDILTRFGLIAPVGVNMGNPHAVFFIDNADPFPLELMGPEVEEHPLFPEKVNVTVASKAEAGFRARTWERGVGITKACGTAACAVLVSAVRTKLSASRSGLVHVDGGTLMIAWDEHTNRVTMAGPTKLHEQGTL